MDEPSRAPGDLSIDNDLSLASQPDSKEVHPVT